MIPSALLLALSLQSASPVATPDEARYAGCLSRIAETPHAAHDEAIAWRLRGGGWPARHCEALAVVALGNHAEGARRLEAAAQAVAGPGARVRAVMLGQAGDAWRLAEEPEAALAAFQAGLAYAPRDPGLLIGRAQSLLALSRFEAAEAAADAALEADMSAPEAWRVRGAARLAQGDYAGAGADAAEARRLDPDNIAVLKLRGDVIAAERGAPASGR